MPAFRPDMLVVSDLHLHAESSPEVEKDFARLLRAHEPCRLVLNGDTFDLDRVAGEQNAGEGAFRAAYRLDALLDRFGEFGSSLCEWVGRGGDIVVLPGNHDAELCLPEVQHVLKKHLGSATERVRFSADAWQQDGIRIEHGHQRDPDNRFYPDTESAVAKERLSAFPLGCLTTRFLLCRIPDFSSRGENHFTPLKVLWRVIRHHGWSTPRMVALYILAALRIARQAWRARRSRDTESGSTMFSPWRVLNRMYLDRVAMTGALLVMVGLFVASLWSDSGSSLVPGAALAAGIPFAALLIRPPSRGRRYRHRDREGCRRAARGHMERGARLVVMGHTHHGEEMNFPSGQYLNPGAFFQPGPLGRPYVVVLGKRAWVDTLGTSR